MHCNTTIAGFVNFKIILKQIHKLLRCIISLKNILLIGPYCTTTVVNSKYDYTEDKKFWKMQDLNKNPPPTVPLDYPNHRSPYPSISPTKHRQLVRRFISSPPLPSGSGKLQYFYNSLRIRPRDSWTLYSVLTRVYGFDSRVFKTSNFWQESKSTTSWFLKTPIYWQESMDTTSRFFKTPIVWH